MKKKKKFSSSVSYQDVPFQKKTRFDGDADAGLAVTLNITVKQNEATTCQTTSRYNRITGMNMITAQSHFFLMLLVWE